MRSFEIARLDELFRAKRRERHAGVRPEGAAGRERVAGSASRIACCGMQRTAGLIYSTGRACASRCFKLPALKLRSSPAALLAMSTSLSTQRV